MRYFLVASLIITFCFSTASWAEDKIAGKYVVIGSLENLKGAKQIVMEEFFNYSCGHCYRFLETSKKLREKYKNKLLHKKHPIHWGNQTPFPAMAFYISDEMGVEEKFTKELFDTNFLMNINIFQPRVIKLLSKDHDMEKEMTEGMQSPRIKAMVAKSLSLADQYKAQETPTVIINKTLKIMPSLTDGDVQKMTDNLDVIIQDILKIK